MDWIPVSTRIWSDPWILSLSVSERLLWLFLITSTDYGFIEYSPALWAIQTGLEVVEIDSALSRFEADKRMLRDGAMLCLPKTLRHRQLRGNNYDGAVRKLREHYGAKYPELVQACLNGGITAQQTGLVPGTDGVATSETSETKHHKQQGVSDSGESEPPPVAPAEKPKRKARVKAADLPAVAELEAQLPAECAEPWRLFALTVANSRASLSVAPTVLAGMLSNFLRRTDGMTPAARAYGLLEAVKHNKPNEGYAATCAAGYRPGAAPPAAGWQDKPLRSVDEALADTPAQCSAEFAAANGIPELGDILQGGRV